jgi:probable F420-dependent oxidoreductase
MRVEIQLDAPPGACADRAEHLAASGIDGLFTFEGPHDVFFPLVEAATRVELNLMTNVAIALPRSAIHLAHMAWDLQTQSGGRFRLGLGSQIKTHIVRRYGSQWSRPAAQMAEQVRAVRAIFAAWQDGAPLDFTGEFHVHTYMPPMFNPGPLEWGPPPILMGALGPVMTRTAAEVADGLLVMPFNSIDHIRERTLPAVAEGLERGGRDPAALQVIPQVICGVGRTASELESGAAGVRALLAFYGSTPAYRPVLDVAGCPELQTTLQGLAKTGDFARMFELISDDLLYTIAVVGTPEECARQIISRFEDVADRVCCYFPGQDLPPDQLRDLVTALHAG